MSEYKEHIYQRYLISVITLHSCLMNDVPVNGTALHLIRVNFSTHTGNPRHFLVDNSVQSTHFQAQVYCFPEPSSTICNKYIISHIRV